MANVTLNFSNVTNNGKPCTDPIILILGSNNVAFPCGDKVDANGNIKLTVPDSVFEGRQCISGVIKCAECDSCKEQDFTICLCDENNPCEACQECVGGVCIDKCPDQKCVNGACCDCETSSDCGNGYLCNGCNCICPTGIKDASGNCVECLTNQQCGPCENCVNGSCVPTCADGLVCSPNGCVCPSGTEWDPVTLTCKPIECTSDANCPECHVCVGGECEPIKCPEGMKCIGGDCVNWPCDKPCTNGADCGEGCGCLNGQCTPCELLVCDGDPQFGFCKDAPGCGCVNGACEGIDNCGEYCDGFTPCTTPGCTCYNNTCVNCANFPCTDSNGGCDSYPGCACDDNGNCGGDGTGGGCNQTLIVNKLTDCSVPDGCALEAVLTSDETCNCDPIRFEVINKTTCGSPANTSLKLGVSMFKGQASYSNYKNEITIGDNEIVNGSIKTTVIHYDKNNNVINTLQVSTPPAVSINLNTINDIVLTEGVHFKTKYTSVVNGQTVELGTRVVIQVKSEGISIPNNGCISYDNNKVLAEYELNFSTPALSTNTCSNITNIFSKVPQETFLNDTVSSKTPLFIWSKGITDFGTGKYNNNGQYVQGGWFRKAYGVKTSTGWSDKVSSPRDGLVANYNYKVAVDCGCATSATYNNLSFCCPTDFTINFSDCNRKITIPRFPACLVNQNLNDLGVITPIQVQTFYKAIINGGEHEFILRESGGNLVSGVTYTHTSSITSVKIVQFYKGDNKLVEVACEKEYTKEYEGSDFNITQECGKIVVTKIASSPNITSVTGKKGTETITFTPSLSNTVWTAISDLLKMNGDVDVTVDFEGACVLTKKVSITCQQDFKATPTGDFATGECPNGTNPDIVAEVVSGFSSAVKFSIDGTNYVSPDTTTPVIKKTFTNLPAGTYTVYAKEKINNVDIVLTKQVVIKPVVKPTAVATDICANTSGSIQITGGAPNSTWKVNGPGLVNYQTSIGPNGNSPVINILPTYFTGNLTTATYLIELISDPSGATCNTPLSATVNKSGGSVSPTIEFAQTSFCQFQEVAFKIMDGGKNLTYNLTASNGTIKDTNGNVITQLQASPTGTFNGVFVATAPSASISITAISSTGGTTCFTLTAPYTKTLSNVTFPALLAGPSITNVDIQCSPDVLGAYWVFVTVEGVATNVTIGGQPLAGPASCGTNCQTWSTYDITLFNNPVVLASNASGCSDSQEVASLPNCDQSNFCPPSAIVQISATPESPTCGQQNVILSLDYTTLGNITGEQYYWYQVIGNTQFLIDSGLISGTAPNPISVLSQFTPEEYVLVIKTKDACEFYSNTLPISAGTSLAPVILGPGISPDTTTISTGNTYTYTTGAIPGATYVWTLSNSNGSNQPIGTNSNSVNISTFADGPNTINVTVTVGTCTGTDSKTINVNLTCPEVIIGYTGVGDNECRGLSATINNLPSGVTPVSWIWYIGGVASSQTGTGVPSNFDPSEIPAGDTEDITIQITFSNGCIITSNVEPYTRCICLCDQGFCNYSLYLPCTSSCGYGLAYTSPIYGVSTDVQITFDTYSPTSGATDSFLVKVINSSTLVETTVLETGYYFTNNTGGCPVTNYPLLLTDLSGYMPLPPSPFSIDVSADVVTNSGSSVFFIEENKLRKIVTLNSDEYLEIYHNGSLCSNQGGYSISLECVA